MLLLQPGCLCAGWQPVTDLFQRRPPPQSAGGAQCLRGRRPTTASGVLTSLPEEAVEGGDVNRVRRRSEDVTTRNGRDGTSSKRLAQLGHQVVDHLDVASWWLVPPEGVGEPVDAHLLSRPCDQHGEGSPLLGAGDEEGTRGPRHRERSEDGE